MDYVSEPTSWAILIFQFLLSFFQAPPANTPDIKQMLDHSIQWEIRESKKENKHSNAEFIQMSGYEPGTQYLVSKEALIKNKYFKEVSIERNQTGPGVQLNIVLNRQGREKFKEVSRKNIGKKLALVANKKVVSSAQIMTEIPDGKISLSAPDGKFYLDELLQNKNKP